MDEARAASEAPRRTLRQRYPWLVPGSLLLLFTLLTVNVLADGPLIPVDRRIHKVIHRTANSPDWRWLKNGPATPARILIDLGNVRFAFPILLAIAGYVAFRRRTLRPLLTAVTGMMLILATVVPLKILIGRPNPGYKHLPAHHLLGAFPSGHTTTACVCYILAVLIVSPRRGRRIWLAAATVLSVLIATSMIWCNLHWFTDVIAGFALSALIIPLTLRLARPDGGPREPGQPPPGESRRLAASADLRAPAAGRETP